MTLTDLLATLEPSTSDLHLVVGQPPTVRQAGVLRRLDYPPFDDTTLEALLHEALPERLRPRFAHDFGDVLHLLQTSQGHFQLHAFRERGHPSAVIRVIPQHIPALDQLRAPSAPLALLKQLTRETSGIVLVTGKAGSGKTTLICSLVDEINQTRAARIVTVEETGTYEFQSKESLVTQQIVGTDTPDVSTALRGLINSNPDVVLIAGLTSAESVGLALHLAATGHLVFAQLDQASTREALQRLVFAFPESNRDEVQRQLANTLRGVVALQLVPLLAGGRVPALEILLTNPMVQEQLRQGDFESLEPAQSMSQALQALVDEGLIAQERAETKK